MSIPRVQSKTINGCRYEVEPLGFTTGRRVFVRLANLVGPALASLDTSSAPKGDATAAASAFTEAIGRLLGGLRDEDLEFFQEAFAKRTRVHLDGGKAPVLADVIEVHFAGDRFADFFEWLVFAFTVTYGDFFVGAWRKIQAALPSASVVSRTITNPSASKSDSPTESPGMNGA